MNLEAICEYCLQKSGVTQHFPFDEQTLVFKVADKMFLLTNINQHPLSLNLKCSPQYALTLRQKYECISPGYHMNKKHWNTIIINGTLSTPFLIQLINHSYDLVVSGLPKKVQQQLKQ